MAITGLAIHRQTYRIFDPVTFETLDEVPPHLLFDPDVSQLNGVARRYWKVSGDSVVQMDLAERQAVDAAELSEAKAAAKANIAAKTKRLRRSITHSGRTFKLSAEDATWIAIMASGGVAADFQPMNWTAEDGTVVAINNFGEFTAFVQAVAQRAFDTYSSGRSLEDAVDAASSVGEVALIQDARS